MTQYTDILKKSLILPSVATKPDCKMFKLMWESRAVTLMIFLAAMFLFLAKYFQHFFIVLI